MQCNKVNIYSDLKYDKYVWFTYIGRNAGKFIALRCFKAEHLKQNGTLGSQNKGDFLHNLWICPTSFSSLNKLLTLYFY